MVDGTGLDTSGSPEILDIRSSEVNVRIASIDTLATVVAIGIHWSIHSARTTFQQGTHGYA